MTTTQKSESINKFSKNYFSGTVVLCEFVEQYSRAMEDRRESEREAEKKTHQTFPNLHSRWPVELEAAKRYTQKIFYAFQTQYMQIGDLRLSLEKDDGLICTYKVLELDGFKRNYTLTYKPSEQSVICSCRKFDFDGIICSHALKLFQKLDYTSLPPKYYLKRWMKIVIDEVVLDPRGEPILRDVDPSAIVIYSELSHIS